MASTYSYQRILDTRDKNEFDNALNKIVLDQLSVSAVGDQVNINTRTINILNSGTAFDSDLLPLVTEEHAGLMTYEDYKILGDLKTRVENLEGTTDRLLYYTSTTLSSHELKDYYYSPSFYINNELYAVDNTNHTVQKIFNKNLEGFTWIGNSQVEPIAAEFNVNFTSNSLLYNKIIMTPTQITYAGDYHTDVVYHDNAWILPAYSTIHFIDGKDIANVELGEWLTNQNNKLNISLIYTINTNNNTVSIDNVTYRFGGYTVGSPVTREVTNQNIDGFVQSIRDSKGQQVYFLPYRGIYVVIDGTFHIWRYYINQSTWRDDGLDTVHQWTNSVAGIIKGAASDGKIYAESDGTGSVYGWDALKTRMSTAEGNITSLQTNKADNVLANASRNGLMSKEDYSKLASIAANAQVNVLEGIKVDGTALVPDGNKSININAADNTIILTHISSGFSIRANIPDPVTIDDVISVESYNPVENRVIALALSGKVDKVEGKQLSTNDFNNTYKTKVDGIASGAQVNVIEQIKVNGVAQTVDANKAVNLSVITDADYHHTDNNFTDALKNKLNGIASGAQVNVIEKIQKNGTDLAISNKTVNISVPTQASDVHALPDSTKYAADVQMTMDERFVIALQLKDQNGNNLGNLQTVDLPLEELISSASYYEQYPEDPEPGEEVHYNVIVMILSTGQEVIIPAEDLVSGFQKEITAANPLNSDLVSDTNSTHKFVTAADITNWNSKQDVLTFLAGTGISITADANNANRLTFALNGRGLQQQVTSLPTANSTSADFLNLRDTTQTTGQFYRKRLNNSGDYAYERVLVASDKTELNNSITTVDNRVTSLTTTVNNKVSLSGTETIQDVKTFTHRPLVKEYNLPENYQQVEYIQSSGTQYIDTGINPNKDGLCNFNMDFEIIDTTSGNSLGGLQLDTTDGETITRNRIIPIYCNVDGSARYGYGQWNVFNDFTFNTTTRYRVDAQLQQAFQSVTIFSVNKTTGDTTTLKTLTGTDSLDTIPNINYYLFKTNYESSDDVTKVRLYRCEIYQMRDGQKFLLRNFVPCQHKFNFTIGLYDTVSNTFFPRADDGLINFEKGSNVTNNYKYEAVASRGEIPVPNNGELTTEILDTLKIGGTNYILGGIGNAVQANPTGSPVSTLNKIKIDDVIYDIPSAEEGTELIWTNQNVAAGFSAQTIQAQMTDYDAAVIVFANTTASDGYTTQMFLRDNIAYRANTSYAGRLCYRGVQVSNSGVVFGSCLIAETYDATLTTNNNYAIPYQIYGVRLKLGSGSGGGGGTTVIANPTGVGTEDLLKISINNIIYDIPQGTYVEANPTGGGNELLNSILIGNTKYRLEAEGGLEIIRRTQNAN